MSPMMLKTRDDCNIVLDCILYAQIIGYFSGNSLFSESKKQNRYRVRGHGFAQGMVSHTYMIWRQK